MLVDIVERLSNWKHASFRRDGSTLETMMEAANEITSLREQLEKAKSGDRLIQALTDPENQPSQFGTVPLEWYENLENKLERFRFKVGEVIDSLDGSYEKHAIRKALQEAIEQ